MCLRPPLWKESGAREKKHPHLAEILVTSALQGYVSGAEHTQGKCDAQVWEESSAPSMRHEASEAGSLWILSLGPVLTL